MTEAKTMAGAKTMAEAKPTTKRYRWAMGWALLASALVAGGTAQARSHRIWPDVGKKLRGQADGRKDAAVIVSIEKYFVLPHVDGAHQNGQAWYQYLTQTRKVSASKVAWLTNTDATGEEIEAAVKKAAGQAQAGGKVWFIYIGHGAPSQNGKDGLLVPVDAQAKVSSLQKRGVPQSRLLSWLAAGKGKPVALIDACFSGRTDNGAALVKGLQPTVVPRSSIPSKATVFTAAGASQFAGPLPGANRPAFSYLMLGGLRGWADANRDKQVTPKELLTYTNTTLAVLLQGKRNQTAELLGGGRKRKLSRARERGPDLAKVVLSLKGVAGGSGAVQCRPGFEFKGARGCVPKEARGCRAGFEFKSGQGCVPKVNRSCGAGFRYQEGTGCVPERSSRVTPPPRQLPQQPPQPKSPGPTETWKNGKGPVMRRIPGGSFRMGSWAGVAANERPVHTVRLPAFWLDETEVTVGQYKVCVAAGVCSAPKEAYSSRRWDLANNWGAPGRSSHPVNGVSWLDAGGFCSWAGKQLPSEEQWEYAARGTAGRKYPWGNAAPSHKLLNAADTSAVTWAKNNLDYDLPSMFSASDGWATTAPVGSFPAGNTPEGIADLAGNVWEWTSSRYCPYTSTGSKNCAKAARVIRGGGWSVDSPSHVRGAFRGRDAPSDRGIHLGFRCSRSD